MKMIKFALVFSVLAVLLGTSAALAHHWVCEYCGYGVSATNMPQPGNSCQKNPGGRYHSWVKDVDDGRSHHWTCAYCGYGVSSSHMPHPGNSCSKNPAGRYHNWIQDN